MPRLLTVEDHEHEDAIRLRKLLPKAVRKALKLMGKTARTRKKRDRSNAGKSELYYELLSVAETMLVEQWPRVNEALIHTYLPHRLCEWHEENHAPVTAVKAATNRKRNQRFRKWQQANPSVHDPREQPNDIPRGLKPEYAKRRENLSPTERLRAIAPDGHPDAGERRRHPLHPGDARPRQAGDDRHLRPGQHPQAERDSRRHASCQAQEILIELRVGGRQRGDFNHKHASGV